MRARPRGFTLIELLIVVAVIGLLIAILLPSLSAARASARASKCAAQLRSLGQGLVIYTVEQADVLVPGRLPKLDDCNWSMDVLGGRKYRPTFLAMMSRGVGVPPFDPPMACASEVDPTGEKGDRQNYGYAGYVCPSVADWTDERNGSYGYNYQFLGNSRLLDTKKPTSFKNWPRKITAVRYPADTVAVADSMGTAATETPEHRDEYVNNANDANRFGNEGFNLDPPLVDPLNGEMAGLPDHRTAVDPRHRGKSAILWVDGHADVRSAVLLGYRIKPDGSFALDGDNALWTGTREEVAWTPAWKP